MPHKYIFFFLLQVHQESFSHFSYIAFGKYLCDRVDEDSINLPKSRFVMYIQLKALNVHFKYVYLCIVYFYVK